ncbi:ParB/RepB/Spo0J family partition protein [Deinococcus soli (ex Cha et al. 2016)]|uniref:ParB family chromosome partitioning protein n=2 Tax=Deinococcus soli (ex Cha et al. 2016) TaxID=1309411 RepID=A0AAE4BPL7_9DEIO|nr:ParB/RepB/Spo0J family partition protein [Deinococcus soli (ex Cha et al. 2016)]MDR6221180.1 ParB family chromosome partitioning protein [Deinococcus soli (ex Cha et al. 2016)]MDR6331113.1 ParB family chromosome partitioning protein [Deinococcus soli (ex Cha et al. 2016)]MDR6753721.1 ParB family chromosome partitioning protein [Deinococcus soli (ex Cha et al. 2016)]
MSRRRPTPAANLTALLGESSALAEIAQQTITVPITDLRPVPFQPRRHFDDKALAELADSIRTQGVLQPLLVRPGPSGYEIIAGERRWRAGKLAGLTDVPVYVRNLTDEQATRAALLENLHREDLNQYEEAAATLRLVALTLRVDEDTARSRMYAAARGTNLEDREVLESLFAAASLGSWQSFTTNKLRVLRYPEAIVQAMQDGLHYSIAAVIAAAPDAHQAELLAMALDGAGYREVKARRAALEARPTPLKVDPGRVTEVGKRISSVKWLGTLDDRTQKDLQSWLNRMPDSVKKAMNLPN